MKTVLLLLLLLLAWGELSSIRAQTSFVIRGEVVDANGSALSEAHVTVSHSGKIAGQVFTSRTGVFEIATAQTKDLLLIVEAKGFERFEQRFTTPPANLRVVLSPRAIAAVVTVAATRVETSLNDVAAAVTKLNAVDLQATSAVTLDDALRQIPGFSLFRRSGSRTANPTSQGISLRGVGASGASRGLVLADDVQLNDPFGGWIYWDRVPRESIDQVEVVEGATSFLYGSGALGGVVNITSKSARQNLLALSGSYGNEDTVDASLFASLSKRGWSTSIAASKFQTSGYRLVSSSERGAVDDAASSRDAAANLTIEKSFHEAIRVLGRAAFFGEARHNGTPLQTNRTHLRDFVFGADWQAARAGSFAFRASGGTQLFDQNFSSISADRNTETLTRVQRVPAQHIDFTIHWSREVGSRQTLVAGFETREVRGSSDELAYVSGRPTSFLVAGGRERSRSVYLEELWRVGDHLHLNFGGRFDEWRNFSAFSSTRPVNPAVSSVLNSFADRVERSFSPQASLVYQPNQHASLFVSVARAFRAPTLNELYRSFRVGNILTNANENLHAEKMTAFETGLRAAGYDDNLTFRASFYWNEINDPVANVTVLTTPLLITRRRQNLGRITSQGVDIQASARWGERWKFSAGYLFANAIVNSFTGNASLEGLQVPQVARHQGTFQSSYSVPRFTLTLQGRAASGQFDDDQNQFRLRSYFNLDAYASVRAAKHLELFIALENVLNRRYEVGKTPVTTLGPPALLRVGFRFHEGIR